MTSLKSIWIEAEHWAEGEWQHRDDNTDVVVVLSDGSRWGATFFSFENIARLRRTYQESGECLDGRYHWATNMILIDEVSRTAIESVVHDLVNTGELFAAFEQLDVSE